MIDTAAFIIGAILSIGGIIIVGAMVVMLICLPFAWLKHERKLWSK